MIQFFFIVCILANMLYYMIASSYIYINIYLFFYLYIVFYVNDNRFVTHAESFCNYPVSNRYNAGISAVSIGHMHDLLFMYSNITYFLILVCVNNLFGRNIEFLNGYLTYIRCVTNFFIEVVRAILSSVQSEQLGYSTFIHTEEAHHQWTSIPYQLCTSINFYLALFIACVVTFILIIASFIFVEQRSYLDKATGYECGFDPFADFRKPLSVKFFLVSILFIIFDIELLFFFPWVLSLPYITIVGFCVLYFFFVFLGILFLYEWLHNCMEW